jgi:hypothetical protein
MGRGVRGDRGKKGGRVWVNKEILEHFSFYTIYLKTFMGLHNI